MNNETTYKILNDIQLLTQEIENRYQHAKIKESQLDKMRVQLEHEIELTDLDAVGMAIKYKQFKGILRLRRVYKNERDSLLSIRGNCSKKQSETAIREFLKADTRHNTARFNDRVSEELRLELLQEVANMNEYQSKGEI